MKALAVLLAVSTFQPQIPKTWKTSDVEALEVPLANPKYSPIHISEVAYYRIPVRIIYKTYPVYHPSREPAGYMGWLKQQKPEIAFDLSRLRTREDWVKAGEVVFNAPTSYAPVFFSAANLRDPSFLEKNEMPVAKDGTVPFARWVIRRRGEVELGSMGCNTCHTRVKDGAVVPGAQGNNPRYGVTNLSGGAQELYDDLYCQRGEAENRIKEAQVGLFATRTSCQHFQSNQLRMMLAALGYDPAGYTSSVEALAAFAAEPHGFDAVLSDETMPQLSGSQMALQIREIRPDHARGRRRDCGSHQPERCNERNEGCRDSAHY